MIYEQQNTDTICDTQLIYYYYLFISYIEFSPKIL